MLRSMSSIASESWINEGSKELDESSGSDSEDITSGGGEGDEADGASLLDGLDIPVVEHKDKARVAKIQKRLSRKNVADGAGGLGKVLRRGFLQHRMKKMTLQKLSASFHNRRRELKLTSQMLLFSEHSAKHNTAKIAAKWAGKRYIKVFQHIPLPLIEQVELWQGPHNKINKYVGFDITFRELNGKRRETLRLQVHQKKDKEAIFAETQQTPSEYVYSWAKDIEDKIADASNKIILQGVIRKRGKKSGIFDSKKVILTPAGFYYAGTSKSVGRSLAWKFVSMADIIKVKSLGNLPQFEIEVMSLNPTRPELGRTPISFHFMVSLAEKSQWLAALSKGQRDYCKVAKSNAMTEDSFEIKFTGTSSPHTCTHIHTHTLRTTRNT